jgi:hypothetical protein
MMNFPVIVFIQEFISSEKMWWYISNSSYFELVLEAKYLIAKLKLHYNWKLDSILVTITSKVVVWILGPYESIMKNAQKPI